MDANGHHPPSPLDAVQAHARHSTTFMESQAEAFTAELEAERTVQDQIKALLSESQARERQLAKVVSTLTGETTTRPTPTRRSGGGRGKGWQISEKKIGQVWKVIRQQVADSDDGTFKMTDLRKAGLSGEAVRRTVVTLHEREVIRVAGALRGGGKLWALMPEAEDMTELAPINGDSGNALWSPNGA